MKKTSFVVFCLGLASLANAAYTNTYSYDPNNSPTGAYSPTGTNNTNNQQTQSSYSQYSNTYGNQQSNYGNQGYTNQANTDQNSDQTNAQSNPNTQSNTQTQNNKYPQDTGATVSDQQLNSAIRNQISNGYFWNSYTKIALHTNSGVVTLDGPVTSQKELQDLVNKILQVNGVRSVISHLTIQNPNK